MYNLARDRQGVRPCFEFRVSRQYEAVHNVHDQHKCTLPPEKKSDDNQLKIFKIIAVNLQVFQAKAQAFTSLFALRGISLTRLFSCRT